MAAIVHLYSIYDKIAEEFGPIFEAANEKVAIRAYFGIVGKSEYPEDYRLMHHGAMDKRDGRIELAAAVTEVPVELPLERSERYENYRNMYGPVGGENE